MKKCDLHIHTINTPSDADFEFSIDVLKDYVEKMQLDVIAITNHNRFDMTQYLMIRNLLNDKIVLPGIEIDVEKGHLLLIFDNDDATLYDFQKVCDDITALIPDENTYISYNQLLNIVGDFSKYLLIPHYDKKPSMSKESISFFGRHILAGEVTSVKKFRYMQNDPNEKLTPVCFSDSRMRKGLSPTEYSTNHTFLDIGDVNINSLRLCLMDKTKSALSAENGNRLFQIFSNGQQLSTGLNIMYGKRSSGKTHTLNSIASKFGKSAKYIRQFELLEKDYSAGQFEDDIRVRQQQKVDTYFKEFRNVVNDIVQVDSEASDIAKADSYATALVESANEARIVDEYSKAALFNSTAFSTVDTKEIEKLIKSVRFLLDTVAYKHIVEKHISADVLAHLLKDLIDRYYQIFIENAYLEVANVIIEDVRKSLQRRSAAPRIPDIDLYGLLINDQKRQRFNKIATAIKSPHIISKESVGNFYIKVSTKRFRNATEAKSPYNRQCSISTAFESYDKPMEYVRGLIQSNIESDQIYKMFVAVDYQVLNASGLPVSGGERSEFNFIQKIQDSALSDILIIDEPESSFDNVFLKNEVNKFIKEMAEIMPVIVSTHNNTIGRSINPDYVLYTEKQMEDNSPSFFLYSGFPGSLYLQDVEGRMVNNYITTLNSLEAGEDAYIERKDIYEALKNQ